MKKRILAVLLCCTMALSFTACGSKEAPAEAPAEESATKDEAAAPAEEEAEESTEEAVEDNGDAADMVLTNGIIQTMVSEGDTAEAIAIKDGEIIFVGTSADAEGYIGDTTEVMDLNGQMVAPGFIDGHTHTVQNLLEKANAVYLNETEPDLEQYKTILKDFVDAHPDAEVIYGTGLNLNAFPDSTPSYDWIDEICPDKIVKIIDMSIHGVLLNQKGLDTCGIDETTEPPINGIIYKNDDGSLTGYFSDCWDLFEAIPEQEFTDEQYADAFAEYEAECNAYGITGINTGGSELDANRERAILKGMEDEGTLTLRVNLAQLASAPFDKAEAETQIEIIKEGQKYDSEFLKASQIKAAFDGVPEAMTVALLEPYAETAGVAADYTGPELTPQADINEYVAAINGAGYQVNIHAMGDASARAALDAYDYSIEQNGEGDYRNIITHLNLVTDEDATRIGEMGVFAAMQPLWWYYDPIFSPLEVSSLGEERFSTEYRIADLLAKNIEITGSVDYPVTLDFRPLAGIQVGATQRSPYDGEETDDTYLRNADQVVPVYEMLKMYTINGAEQMEMEDLIGTIEVGKKADLVVLADNILDCEKTDIADTAVTCTISDGRIVYEA